MAGARPTQSLYDFGRECFDDGNSAQECVDFVLRAELDELKKDGETHEKIKKHFRYFVDFQDNTNARSALVEASENDIEEAGIRDSDKIAHLDRQYLHLIWIHKNLGSQHKAVRYIRRLFVEKITRPSVLGFQLASRIKSLKSRIENAKIQRDEKKLASHRMKRVTFGRKRMRLAGHHPEHVLLENKAIEQAKDLPRIDIIQANPRTSRDSTLTWHSVTPFENGAWGNVFLELGVDSNNVIRNRVVRKIAKVSAEMRRSPTAWRGDLNVEVNGDGFGGGDVSGDVNGKIWPMEWLTQTLACNAPGAESILPILGTPRIASDEKSFTVYTAYAAVGDLFDVESQHREARGPLPMPFLLMCFKQLVDTALILKQGSLSADTAKAEWQQIIHRDYKPENVFLDLPQPHSWPMYPQLKLGDFGLAFMTSEDDELNPGYWANGKGTKDCVSPEQIPYEDPHTLTAVDDFQMLSPCNVWGIGLTMFVIMHSGPDTAIKQPGVTS
ncbi:hypothetical protein PRZ48_004808 [Zasmidium cellare]|uniref:Protein kinase domain-containing protein n=1 Tax=Zasmidium cellare TaxID=395010 RepID=A0ABR0ES06_ZASCE|nr:hypothetical protein PRZ48_004808 [Zasmidium cellare]